MPCLEHILTKWVPEKNMERAKTLIKNVDFFSNRKRECGARW